MQEISLLTKGSRLLRRSAVLGLFALVACEEAPSAPTAGQQPPPPPVTAAPPLVSQVVEWDEFTGRFEAMQRVELRARVSGYLHAVHFRDGEIVEVGDLLFTIDPRPFEAALAAARAELLQARSQLDLATQDLERAERLSQSQNISEQTVDERRAEKLSAEAEVAAARANIRIAELDLEFTQIRAPVTGRISERRVDVGNLISGGSNLSDALAVIVSLDPIYFIFDTSEADHLRYVRLSRQGKRVSSRERANPVYVRLMDEQEWLRRGQMNYVGNELDPNSGTIRGRAIFENDDLLLTPGIFGRLRLIGSGAYEAMLLPDRAVLSDQSRKIVLTVDDEGTVTPAVVELGPIHRGLRIIRSGIEPDDRVIIEGVQRARPGSKVTVEPGAFDMDPQGFFPAFEDGSGEENNLPDGPAESGEPAAR